MLNRHGGSPVDEVLYSLAHRKFCDYTSGSLIENCDGELRCGQVCEIQTTALHLLLSHKDGKSTQQIMMKKRRWDLVLLLAGSLCQGPP